METLETELARARDLDPAALADAIESIGFECTRCGACCKGYEPSPDEPSGNAEGDTAGGDDGDSDREPHTATVFPDEVRRLQAAAAAGSDGDDATESDSVGNAAGDTDGDDSADTDGESTAGSDADVDVDTDPDATYDWRDVARPMPYGLSEGDDGPEGETFEWALQTDACGDCTFYEEAADGTGGCTVHADRPLICRTYPFSVDLGGTSQPMGEAVDEAGMVRAHECEGLGREIDRSEAESLARALRERAIRDLEEAIAVRERYEPVSPATREAAGGVVVHDSEGAKRADGEPIER